MARRTINLPVDERTDALSDEALYCRSKGHHWQELAMSRKRFRELLAQGCTEERSVCANGCGWTREAMYDLNGFLISEKRKYVGEEPYAMPVGTGRLSRAAARVARFSRRYQAFK